MLGEHAGVSSVWAGLPQPSSLFPGFWVDIGKERFLLGRMVILLQLQKNQRSFLSRKSEPWELVEYHLAFANASRSLLLAPLATRGFPVLLRVITGNLLQ